MRGGGLGLLCVRGSWPVSSPPSTSCARWYRVASRIVPGLLLLELPDVLHRRCAAVCVAARPNLLPLAATCCGACCRLRRSKLGVFFKKTPDGAPVVRPSPPGARGERCAGCEWVGGREQVAGTRRGRVEGGRPHGVLVWLSTVERVVVEAAAVRAGMAVGAWLGSAGVRSAEADAAGAGAGGGGVAVGSARSAGLSGARMQALMGLRAELMEDRRVLRNVGGNLNDIARVANTDGVVEVSAVRVLDLVSRVVERIDATVVAVDEQVGVERAVVRARARSRAQRDRGSGPGESGGVG